MFDPFWDGGADGLKASRGRAKRGHGAAFNPFDDAVRKGAHVVVEGTDMLPVLDALLGARKA